ncbi:uncharacterized protein LOC126680193 [Mercurialis annua]|uniref:uncharacterized protein LOC126680193 n=1 Tax=Mercurialis annua TaxID=3986 RepID=UPI00215FFAD5|nr:uncharacterized protein LOC126680193 [Mercurialis annua]
MATAGDSRSFLVRVHHGGKFVRDPGLRYSNGEMEDYEIFDIDKLNYRRIVNMVAQVGYGNYPRLWWLRPGGKIDCDLIYFYDDSGMHQLLNTMKNGETIDMYCEHAVDHPEIINQLTDADSHNVEVMGDYEDLGYFDIDVDIGPNTDDENEELASAREKKKTYAEEQKAEDLESSDEEDTVEPEVVSSNPDRAVLEEVGSDIEYQNVDDGYESIDEEADNQGNSVLRVKKTRKVLYNPNVNAQSFLVGMVFKNMKEFKLACTKYSILRGVDIDFVRNEKDRVRAVCCFKNCPWLCFASKEGNTGDVKIKKYIPKHMCMKSFTNRRITSKYLAFHLREVIENKPSIRVTVLREMAKQDLKFEIGYYMVKRAKQQVLQETKGNYVKEYATLHDYAQEIRETNIGSTVVVLPIRGTNQFDFFYVCFDALKKGWKQGCRPVIGMDGCFLKTECGGQLLTAVGRDGNDQQFPIAWAVVKVENKQTWTWFIKLLKTDLEITDGDGLVVVTDMQKPRGRPKKNRRKEPDEPKKAGKLSKKGISIKCSVCREYGHNKNGCKNRVKAQTNQTSGNPTSENLNQSDAEIAKEYYFHYEKPENVPSSENIVQDLLTRAANKESQTTSKDQEHKEASTKKKKNAKEPTGIIFEGGRASIDSVFFLENFHKEKVSYDKEQMRTIGLVQPPASYQGNPSYGRFKSPGLRWDGSPAVTVNQLQADVERAKRSRNPSDETQAAMASQSKEGNQTTDAQRTHKMQKTRPTWRP